MAMRNREDDGMITKVVSINRVSKTVKGGRIMKFAALVVVGDGKGTIGYGIGKSGEVPEAIRKGEAAAKKNMHKVALKGTTIPHEIVGKYGAGAVLLKPAAPGTGMIAGGPVRAVIEAAGIKDVRAKSMRSNNPINVVAATFAGLCGLVSAESVAEKLGKTVKQSVRVEHRAAREDRQRAAGPDFRDELRAVLRKVRDVIRFTDIADINQVVRHAAPLCFSRFGGPDIHPAVDER